MTPDQLSDLRLQQAAYIDRLRQRGRTIVEYTMPCCGGKSETPAQPPDADRQWDTTATCEHCGALYMKITRGDVVTAVLLEES